MPIVGERVKLTAIPQTQHGKLAPQTPGLKWRWHIQEGGFFLPLGSITPETGAGPTLEVVCLRVGTGSITAEAILPAGGSARAARLITIAPNPDPVVSIELGAEE